MKRRNFLSFSAAAAASIILPAKVIQGNVTPKQDNDQIMPVMALKRRQSDAEWVNRWMLEDGLHIIAGKCGTGKTKLLTDLHVLLEQYKCYSPCTLINFEEKSVFDWLINSKKDNVILIDDLKSCSFSFYEKLNEWGINKKKRIFLSFQLKASGRGSIPFEEMPAFCSAKKAIEMISVETNPKTNFYRFKILRQ